MNRRYFLSSALTLALTGLPLAATAQSAFPDKPVHITVVWPAGGGHDLVGRLLGNELSAVLDTPVVVDNVVGAGGTTGMRQLADAASDGYTIGVVGMHAIVQSYMNVNAPQMSAFEPLLYLSDEPGALEISAEAAEANDITTLADYVARAKDDPMAFLNGNDPEGGNSSLFADVIGQGLGVPFTKLPYPGHAPTVTALLTGEVQTATLPVPPVLEHARAGSVKVLGVAARARHPKLPDVPTFAEQGFDIQVQDFVAVIAPKGLPEEVRTALSDGLMKAAQSEAFTQAADKNGMMLRLGGPELAAAEIAQQEETIYPLLDAAGAIAPERRK